MRKLSNIIIKYILCLILNNLYSLENKSSFKESKHYIAYRNETIQYSLTSKQWFKYISNYLTSSILNFKNYEILRPFINRRSSFVNYSLIQINNSIGIYNSPKEPYPIIYDQYGKDVNNGNINAFKKILIKNICWNSDQYSPLNETNEWYSKTKVSFILDSLESINQYSGVFGKENIYEIKVQPGFSRLKKSNSSYIIDEDFQESIEEISNFDAKRILFNSPIPNLCSISALINNNSLKHLKISTPIEPKHLSELNNQISRLKSLEFSIDFGKVNKKFKELIMQQQVYEEWNEMINNLSSIKTIKELNIFALGKCQLKNNYISIGFKKILSSPTCSIQKLILSDFGFVDQVFLDALIQNKSISYLALLKSKNINKIITQVLPNNNRIKHLNISSSDFMNIEILKLITIQSNNNNNNNNNLYSITLHLNNNDNDNEYNLIIEYLALNNIDPVKEINIVSNRNNINHNRLKHQIILNNIIINVILL